jgi:hypothetical protein
VSATILMIARDRPTAQPVHPAPPDAATWGGFNRDRMVYKRRSPCVWVVAGLF